jgi:hypothetical protein
MKAIIKARATYKQPALVVLSGRLMVLEEEQAVLVHISK